MNEATSSEDSGDELRDEYEFTPEQLRGAERGKYAERYVRGTNLVLLDPDVPQFPRPRPSTRRCGRASVILARSKHNEAA